MRNSKVYECGGSVVVFLEKHRQKKALQLPLRWSAGLTRQPHFERQLPPFSVVGPVTAAADVGGVVQ